LVYDGVPVSSPFLGVVFSFPFTPVFLFPKAARLFPAVEQTSLVFLRELRLPLHPLPAILFFYRLRTYLFPAHNCFFFPGPLSVSGAVLIVFVCFLLFLPPGASFILFTQGDPGTRLSSALVRVLLSFFHSSNSPRSDCLADPFKCKLRRSLWIHEDR